MSDYKQPLTLATAIDRYSGETGIDMPIEAAATRISHYIWILKRYRWRFVGFMAAMVAAAWIVSAFVMRPVWESTVTLTIQGADQVVTQARLIQSDAVLRPVVNQYDLLNAEEKLTGWETRDPEAPLTLKKLKITNPPFTSLLLVTYQSKDRHRAAGIANAIARSYVLHSLADLMSHHLETLKATLLATLRQLEADRTRVEADRLAKQATRSDTHETRTSGAPSKSDVAYQEALRAEAAIQTSIAKNTADLDHLNTHFAEYQELIRNAETTGNLYGPNGSAVYNEIFKKLRDATIDAGLLSNAAIIADPARPAAKPISPNVKLNVLIALLFSAVLAVGAAVVVDRMDATVRTPDQIRGLLDLPVLATLPQLSEWSGKISLALGIPSRKESEREIRPDNAAAAAYIAGVDALRESLLTGAFRRPIHSILFTSADPSEGKTMTAVHLALANAKLHRKTLLIDANFRHPGVHHKLGITVETGLGIALQNGLPWQTEVISMGDLDVAPAGRSNRHAAALIGGSLPQILNESELTYDLVIIDGPSILGIPEVAEMSTAVDGVVLVATAQKTAREAAASAAFVLHQLRANLLGMVLNEYRERP
jgi:Mrp family chromosome partitioning ATPase/uncharacterized protein involved in exopolysaccharide biosynthesis